MADFDDVPLRRPPDPTPPPEADPPPGGTGFPLWIPLAIGAVFLAGAALWFLGRPADTPVAEDARPVTEQQVRTPPAERLPAEPGEDIDLPPLDASDALIRELIARLSAHPRVMAYLTTDHLVRNMTVVTVNIADGKTPSNHLRTVRPAGEFQVRSEGRELLIDPRSFSRYDSHADAIRGLDPRSVARFYATIRPRIDEAYRDLGAPHGNFDATLERAIVELLRTPIPEGEVPVRGDRVAYTYADPRFEELSHAQRQFLRMGPRNMRIVKEKLREVAPHLGIPESRLPR